MRRALRQMKRIYRNSSITHKLFLAFSLLIAVPAILIAFLFIHIQEEQLYKEAMASGSSHVMHLNEQLRSRMSIIENVSSIALAQKSFVDYIHSDMRSDGLGLVKFRQNQFEQMRHIIQSNKMISQLSFYVDNPNVQEIWPEIYSYDRFWPQEYWLSLRNEGGAAYRLFALKDGEHTLAYYRLVRLQSQLQKYPSIMEVRSSHSEFFGDLLDDTNSTFFSVVMDANDPARTIYNDKHAFVHNEGDHLGDIFTSIHKQLDMLQQTDPIQAKVGGFTYYAQYHYIAPLNAYVVDIASREALLKGPRSWYVLVIAIALIGLLLMLVLVSQMNRRIFRRLDSVLLSMRKVRGGQLDAKIETGLGPNETGDEIDEVAVSYNGMLEEIQRLMTQVVDKQLVAKNAQLHSLHSQINSHFLYNALESIRMLAEVERRPAIADAVVTLGSLMRYSMKWRSDTVAFGEELANIQSYVQFINFMESGGIELTADYPPEVLQYAIPKMCMQPIVENAVRHAAPSGGGVHIRIHVSVDNDSLLINIRDNGVGVEPYMLENLQAVLRGESDAPITGSNNGLGLENVHKRLQLHYGTGSGLWMESEQGVYTCVTIRLPWENDNLGGW
ncbi:two-component system sensor histidine kinase YesM [Paenibacillus cellulosilyticus]|uniref:histidine kinase n=1 Tax=Paenibacillus cellulosilyticus TaxID=375489 RepID=A0A2V2YVD3_9BACL|nr:histidine kinase [Paenibacillus cellulosilyticus]PWW05059.1 two-component system sensor histidine kinase YesM [Paenibacillus cellulosilyticus]QKS48615.1 histidine kinase [Paenibacillus cellulosilyticus]